MADGFRVSLTITCPDGSLMPKGVANLFRMAANRLESEGWPSTYPHVIEIEGWGVVLHAEACTRGLLAPMSSPGPPTCIQCGVAIDPQTCFAPGYCTELCAQLRARET